MKFLTAVAVVAITIANGQNVVTFGSEAMVTDYAEATIGNRRLQIEPVHFGSEAVIRNLQVADEGLYPRAIVDDIHSRRLQDVVLIDEDVMNRRLQDVVLIDEDVMNRRLQDNTRTFEVPVQNVVSNPLRLNIEQSNQDEKSEPKLGNNWQDEPELLGGDHDIWIPHVIPIDQVPIIGGDHDNWKSHAMPVEQTPIIGGGEHDYQHPLVGGDHDYWQEQRGGPHHRHRGERRPMFDEVQVMPQESIIFDRVPIEYTPEDQMPPVYQNEEHEREHKKKHKKNNVTCGIIFTVAIALIAFVLVKCCCAKKCGKKRRDPTLHMTPDQKIHYHRTELMKLQNAREQERQLQMQMQQPRMMNPYHQYVQAPPPVNPYTINHSFEEERIAFGQRPPMNFHNYRNVQIPVGRPVPSFEGQYPTL